MARAPERDREAFGDVAERELLEADELEGGALPLGQPVEAGAEEPAALLAGEERLRYVGAVGAEVEQLDRLAAIGSAALQVGLAAQRAVVGVLEQPDFHGPALRIVEVRLAGDLEEDFLGDVFRFSGIAEDVGRDAVDESGVAAQQQIERVAAGLVKLMKVGDQLRIGPGGCGAVAISGPPGDGDTARREDAHDGYLTSML